ncbi:tRNA nucleotidyltransferase, CC-adding [Richelia intracellularis HH01]|uniref:tRNA nucleotidyltransferase, CC-adding n=1 Tax=Richelia intracellularis HH01 TaxID=1165094 RepID=M1WZI8_9NOST|nr:CCA tRNA nucleotidyltransferase [Richelia intracellularis]CCH66843.1 tRNA nucleotidyltransferase, CC-adding [Richelia intracellularis HH01]
MQDSAISSLSPEKFPFDMKLLPQQVYIVGGAVRDAILSNSREYLDLDFVLPKDAIKVAQHIAKYHQAGFVVLDSERKIARVIFPNATVDFAQQEGDSIEADLHRRDFTVNAIAYNPHTREIIDPLQGSMDLTSRLMRMISYRNLANDPLRLLRAYRQASQLDFVIETDTRIAIRNLAPKISQTAVERVRVELCYLLNIQIGGTHWLENAWEDGLLALYFSHATKESFSKLSKIDVAARKLEQAYQFLGKQLQEYILDTVKITWCGIAKLACLVHPQPEIAETELNMMTYSRAEIKAVIISLRLLPHLKVRQMSLREKYFFFRAAGKVFPAVVLFALGNDYPIESIEPLITHYLNDNDLVAHPNNLVNGKEIMESLGIPASPIIGKILVEIAVAQAEGRVSTKYEAVALAKQLREEAN